jgi:transketolase
MMFFISYAWGAARLSALSHLRVLMIMTHDSIGLGEDGPTHQPIETLIMTRATPNMLTFRPADGNEVSGAYLMALESQHRPSVLSLTRQNVPHLEGTSIEAVLKGGYILQDVKDAKLILVATGSEVQMAVEAASDLNNQGIPTRVVSMPCTELYDEQPLSYKKSVLTPGIPIVSVEALGVHGWDRYAHGHVGMRSFGASAPAEVLYKQFHITKEDTIKMSKKVLAHFEKVGYVHEVRLDFLN